MSSYVTCYLQCNYGARVYLHYSNKAHEVCQGGPTFTFLGPIIVFPPELLAKKPPRLYLSLTILIHKLQVTILYLTAFTWKAYILG